MKIKLHIIFSLFMLSISMFSCEKVIRVDVNNADKKYVVEGIISDNANSCKVNLSRTLNITDSNQFEGVDNAVITVAEDNKAPVSLSSAGAGLYRAQISGKPGHTYKLNIKVNGEVFTATSTMPSKVYMDTLYVTERVFLGKVRKIATVELNDPPGLGNAYRLIQYVNGKKENTIFIFDDNLVDGRKIVYELLIFGGTEYSLLPGDQLRVEMRCIDNYNYQFLYSLTQSSLGQSQSASPGNPLSTISGGAIGYFSANTFEIKNIIVQ